jgi:hypothetical protein
MRTSERDMVLRAIDELGTRFANNPQHHERELGRLEAEVKAGTWPGRRKRVPRTAAPKVGPRGFPICRECRAEAIGPNATACTKHWTEGVDGAGLEAQHYTAAQRKRLVALLAEGAVWRPRSGGEKVVAEVLLRRGLLEAGQGRYALTALGRAEAERLQAASA